MYQVRQVEISHDLENIYLEAAIFQVKKLEPKLEWAKLEVNFAIAGIRWKLFWLLF